MKPLLVLAALAASPLALAQAVHYEVGPAAVALTYRVSHPFHVVVGVSRSAAGSVDYDPAKGGTVRIAAPVKSFDSGNKNRDAHALEVLFAHRNPEVVFEARLPPGLPDKGKVTLEGTLTLKGVAAPAKAEVEFERSATAARVKATLSTTFTAHAMERPTLMFLAVADELKAEAEVALVAK